VIDVGKAWKIHTHTSLSPACGHAIFCYVEPCPPSGLDINNLQYTEQKAYGGTTLAIRIAIAHTIMASNPESSSPNANRQSVNSVELQSLFS
jgi:hypothetical protein